MALVSGWYMEEKCSGHANVLPVRVVSQFEVYGLGLSLKDCGILGSWQSVPEILINSPSSS